MHEIRRIQTQMEQAFSGNSWVNVSLMSILEGVTAATASARPIPSFHTIWEIVLHLHNTQLYILQRLQDEGTDAAPLEQWPSPPEPTRAAWEGVSVRLVQAENELRRLLGSFPEEKLDEPLTEGGTSAYNNLHGYIQHAFYHAGQIQLLKKQLLEPSV